jgi:hypothetical protein
MTGGTGGTLTGGTDGTMSGAIGIDNLTYILFTNILFSFYS